MDSRTAAHVLGRIADHLALRGENRFKSRAYESASRAVLSLGVDDLAPLLASGALADVRGLGPATIAVVRDLVETGESRYLEELRETTPDGLLELLRVPGLSAARIHQFHDALDIRDLDSLEDAARSGALATLPGIGPKTALKILDGVRIARESATRLLLPHGLAEGERLLAMVRQHPDVVRAELAGAVRRGCEIVEGIDVVAGCRDGAPPEAVAQSFTRVPGVRETRGTGAEVAIIFGHGARLDLVCVADAHFPLAHFLATGGAEHVSAVMARLRSPRTGGPASRRSAQPAGTLEAVTTEEAIYRRAGLDFVDPALRENRGEIEAADRGALPALLDERALRGVLHCHTRYSDGRNTIAAMAQAARERGWSYIGITDHSAAAFYANGLSREQVMAQHEEIDAVNAELGPDFRVLRGIEADILADGRLDYDEQTLNSFDFVVGSIHARFSMDRQAMTTRVLRALDDPRLTILAHPTGRLLLAREPYGLDLDAVIDKAAAVGVALELNADPRRLDLDWRHVLEAKRRGATIAIGPDAHSTASLANVRFGVLMARKGWLAAADVLNTRSADDVIAFARARGR